VSWIPVVKHVRLVVGPVGHPTAHGNDSEILQSNSAGCQDCFDNRSSDTRQLHAPTAHFRPGTSVSGELTQSQRKIRNICRTDPLPFLQRRLQFRWPSASTNGKQPTILRSKGSGVMPELGISRREFIDYSLAASLVGMARPSSFAQPAAGDHGAPYQLYWGDLHNHNAVEYAKRVSAAFDRDRPRAP
jgi:hypothetical protein